MEAVRTPDFAAVARTLTQQARRRGLVAPGFRCPPRLVGVDRSIRRRSDGAVIAVRLRGRPLAAVVADMIEGVVVANRLEPPAADRVRAELWAVFADRVTLAPSSSYRDVDETTAHAPTSMGRVA